MSNDTYNGWSNDETWVTKLWMDNDEGAQAYWAERITDCIQSAIDDSESDVKQAAARMLAEEMKSQHEEYAAEINGVTGVFADLMTHALGRVDFDEIADNMLSDVDIYSAGWNTPGYLPDSDPAVFADADSALEYIQDAAKSAIDDDATSDQITETEAEALFDYVDTWKADSDGEFEHTFRGYHYFITKV